MVTDGHPLFVLSFQYISECQIQHLESFSYNLHSPKRLITEPMGTILAHAQQETVLTHCGDVLWWMDMGFRGQNVRVEVVGVQGWGGLGLPSKNRAAGAQFWLMTDVGALI